MGKVKNYMETLVEQVMSDVLAMHNGCKCERCVTDIAAYALNNLKPRYFSENEVYAKLDTLNQQSRLDAMARVMEAAVVVHEKPRH